MNEPKNNRGGARGRTNGAVLFLCAVLLFWNTAAAVAVVQQPSSGETSQNGSAPPALAIPLQQSVSDVGPAGAASTHQSPPSQLLTAPRQRLSGQPAVTVTAAPGSHQTNEDNSTTLHLLVGRSLFLTSGERLRRVYISNPLVLESMTASPYQIVVTSKAPGSSSVVLWNETEQATVYTVLSDIDIATLQSALSQALPGDLIQVEADQGRIALKGVVSSDAAAETAVKIANVYSKSVIDSLVVDQHHIPQVRLKVRFCELDRSKLNQFGVNFVSLNSGHLGTGSTQQFAPISIQTQNSSGEATTPTAIIGDFLNLFYFNTEYGIGGTLSDMESKNILQILAEPTLMALNGTPAKFLAGGEFPFPVVQGSNGGFTSVTVQFRQYGVKLEFTPYVNGDGTIRLKVLPEVSALDYSNTVTISGFTIPALSTRRAETEVELKNGQTFAISGLLDRRVTDQLRKVPGIGDVPILGELFRSKSLNHSVSELIVIVTPEIVDPLNNQYSQPQPPKWPVPYLDPTKFDSGWYGQKQPPAGSPATKAKEGSR